MERFTVKFTYYNGDSSADDEYRFSNLKDARDKFNELCDMIRHTFDGVEEVDVVEEPDFFSMHARGDVTFSRVTLS